MNISFLPVGNPIACDEHYIYAHNYPHIVGILTWNTGMDAGWRVDLPTTSIFLGPLSLTVEEAKAKANRLFFFME